MSDTEKDCPQPPPVTKPTQPDAPKDTGGSGKRCEQLDSSGDGDASPYQISSKSVKRLQRYRIYFFSKWRPTAILDFRSLIFWTADKLWRTNAIVLFVKIGQIVSRYCDFSIFQAGRRLPSWILKFWNFEIFCFLSGERAKMHHHTKFHQNRSNGCRDIAFNVLQNGGRPPSWIF